MKIFAVLGLSGVGKSTLVATAAEQHKLLHLKAIDLIKARLAKPQSSEQLRRGSVLDNQALMLAEFEERIATTDHSTVVFDGHSLIDATDGLVEIPLSVFETIKPDGIVFVEDAPVDIVARRNADTSRVRPSRSAFELAQYQTLARGRAAYFGKGLAVPFYVLAPTNVIDLVAILTGRLFATPTRKFL